MLQSLRLALGLMLQIYLKYCFAKPLFGEQVVFSLVIELLTVNDGSIQLRKFNLAVDFINRRMI